MKHADLIARLRRLAGNERALDGREVASTLDEAADALERPTITDDMVEAGAAGMWDRHGKPGLFAYAPDHLRSAFKKDARAALTAALGIEVVADDPS